jgi:hypothetical protein
MMACLDGKRLAPVDSVRMRFHGGKRVSGNLDPTPSIVRGRQLVSHIGLQFCQPTCSRSQSFSMHRASNQAAF